MKCSKCDNEATYDSPADYCSYHWCEWWFDGWSRKHLIEEIAELMDRIAEYDNDSGGLV